jgi:hypothetical protein
VIWLFFGGVFLLTLAAGLFGGWCLGFPAGWMCGRTHDHVPAFLPAQVKAYAHMKQQEGAPDA